MNIHTQCTCFKHAFMHALIAEKPGFKALPLSSSHTQVPLCGTSEHIRATTSHCARGTSLSPIQSAAVQWRAAVHLAPLSSSMQHLLAL